ncbi:ABC transporter [Nocardioides rubriscoriae]|uniref:ABC transporter n=1 Tax=Nocardioides rubriscoriae TaxID=642762 RepID=UPI0011DF9127|nr:ABC transporter [Nocardioides rubriscoriae]
MTRATVVRAAPPTLATTLAEAATLPWRLAVAATRATLAVGHLAAPDGPIRRPDGYAELVLQVIGERGYLAQLMELVRDDGGPMRLANTLTELIAPDRPLGRLLARDGVLDGLMDDDGPLVRLLARDGALERLLADDGPLDRLVAEEGVLERLLAPGGPVDRLTERGGLIDTVLERDGFVDKLVAEGGTLDQLVALGETLQHIKPRLEAIGELIPELSAAADGLNRAVGPLSDLVGRLPGGRRRTAALS